MPLYPYMLQCVVRIIGDRMNVKTGQFERRALGTGFYMRVQSESVKDRYYGYLVTAHHVIDGQPNPDLAFPDPYHPGQLYPLVRTEGPAWRQPLAGADLAVLPFAQPQSYFVYGLEVGKNLWPELPGDAMLAMPFHYVGLLEPLDRAMARSGTLGAINQEGIDHPDGYDYTCHLGDCRSYGGFSGSPCFLELTLPGLKAVEPPAPLPEGTGDVGEMVHMHLMCGMVTWHLEKAVEQKESSAFGVLCMLTSDDLWRALMSDELVKERREQDALVEEPDAVPRNVSTGPSRAASEEFDRFEDLTRKLANTPKPR